MNKNEKTVVKHVAASAVILVLIWIGALNVAYHVTFVTMMMIFTLAMVLSCVIMTHNILLQKAYDSLEDKE